MRLKRRLNGKYDVEDAEELEVMELILRLRQKKAERNDNWGFAIYDVFSQEENCSTGMSYSEVMNRLNGNV